MIRQDEKQFNFSENHLLAVWQADLLLDADNPLHV
jgi:hypothetical protein